MQIRKLTLEDFAKKYFAGRVYIPENTQGEYPNVIEHILLGLPLNHVYVFEDDDGAWEIISHSAWLYSLVSFINGDFKLSDMQVYKSLNGKGADILSRSEETFDITIWNYLNSTRLQFFVCDNDSPKDVLEYIVKNT